MFRLLLRGEVGQQGAGQLLRDVYKAQPGLAPDVKELVDCMMEMPRLLHYNQHGEVVQDHSRTEYHRLWKEWQRKHAWIEVAASLRCRRSLDSALPKRADGGGVWCIAY